MTRVFDPYVEWLGIAQEDQPPNYYRLLGIELFEDDSEVIQTAARRRVALLKEKLPEDRGRWSRRLLREVAAAQGCLTHADRKAAYNCKLKAKASPPSTPSTVATAVVTGVLPAEADAPQAEAGAIPPIVRPIEAPPIIATSAPPVPLPVPVPGGEQDPEPPPVVDEPDGPPAASVLATATASAPWAVAGPIVTSRQSIRRKPTQGQPLTALVGATTGVLALLAVIYFAVDHWGQPAPREKQQIASTKAPEVRTRRGSEQGPAAESKPVATRTADRLEEEPLVAQAPPQATAQRAPPPVERQPEARPAAEPRTPAVEPAGPPGGSDPLIGELPEWPLQDPADKSAAPGLTAPRSTRVRPELVELTGDPKDVLLGRGLNRQKEYWLLADDDDLQAHLGPLDELDKKYKAADLALAKALQDIQKLREQLPAALQAREPAAVQVLRQKLQEASVAYRSLLKTTVGTRGELTAKLVSLAQRAERLEATYQNLSDDPEVLAALQQLGPTNRLGPTLTFVTNRNRLAAWEEHLLTDQTAGFWGDQDGDVFYVPVVVNERTAALFAVQLAAEINLIPAGIVQEAGIEVAAEPQYELTVRGVMFRAAKVKIPSLRLGKFVSADVEAFVVPADVSLGGFLNATAFPGLKLDVHVGQHLLTVRPLPPPR